MPWKKDLQKLKHAMGAEDPAPAKAAPPPKPKPAGFKPFEEEDEVFLSAMGRRPQAKAPTVLAPAPAPKPAPKKEEPSADEFASAMGDLKGMVALRAPGPGRAAQAPSPATAAPAPPPPEPQAPESPAPEPEAADAPAQEAPVQPLRINLAAGMAIDVDGGLDLKGHGRADAEERLKERILDGHALGWRTLHVVLGPSEDLRLMLQELLKGPGGALIARYAQAPIPMGGSQAWILYFRNPLPPPDAN